MNSTIRAALFAPLCAPLLAWPLATKILIGWPGYALIGVITVLAYWVAIGAGVPMYRFCRVRRCATLPVAMLFGGALGGPCASLTLFAAALFFGGTKGAAGTFAHTLSDPFTMLVLGIGTGVGALTGGVFWALVRSDLNAALPD